MVVPEVAHPVGKTVDENISPGMDALVAGILAICLVRIGDMDRTIEIAMRVSGVQDVLPFWRSSVPLLLLVTLRLRAECDLVDSERRLPLHQEHRALALEHEHPIRLRHRGLYGAKRQK